MKRQTLETIQRTLNHPLTVVGGLLLQMAIASYAVYRDWFALAVASIPFIALDAWRFKAMVG